MSLAELLQIAAVALVGLALIMSAGWLIQRLTGNAGWIDAVWTFGVGAMGVAVAFTPVGEGGTFWRRAFVAALAAAWSLRLGLHIVRRTLKAGDDPRYRKTIDDWGEAAPRRLFAFLQAQAVVGAVLAVAIAFAAHAHGSALRLQDVVGMALMAVAIVGEALADFELARFKAEPANRGAICNAGLWRLSRHPNYLCEFMLWVAVAVIALDPRAPLSLLALLAPAIMYWTLRYASGVPPLEEHMQRTRPERFAAYAARTPAFFPRIW
jgi:steroid 5-alpha reductase family enzyme